MFTSQRQKDSHESCPRRALLDLLSFSGEGSPSFLFRYHYFFVGGLCESVHHHLNQEE